MELGERLGATPSVHQKLAITKGEKAGFKDVDMRIGGGRAVEVGPELGRGLPKLRIDG